MSFSKKVKEDVLVACGRHCCLCHRFCGTKIEIHHIKLLTESGTDTFENAIALCFNCHADMVSYDAKHPKGSKYSERELKLHRDKWYKKVEGALGLVHSEEAAATDRIVYETIIKILPWNGSMRFIRNTCFDGASFESSRLDDLHSFMYECNNPSFEFIDPDIEGLRVSLKDNLDDFLQLIGGDTFPTWKPGWNEIPPQWQQSDPDRFKRVVEGLHKAADMACDSYDALVRLATRKLGIVPALTIINE